jgi:hypothetical protein
MGRRRLTSVDAEARKKVNTFGLSGAEVARLHGRYETGDDAMAILALSTLGWVLVLTLGGL